MGSSQLWHSIPNGASHIFYINGVEHGRISQNLSVISSTAESVSTTFGLSTPYGGTTKYGSCIIAEAQSSWARSNFCVCVNNTANGTSAVIGDVRMRVRYNSFTEFYGAYSTGTLPFTFMSYASSTNITTSTNISVALKVNGAIWATGLIATSSSREIKKDIEELDDLECLNKLLQLKPCKYRYIDNQKNSHATKKVFGFIAEEVKEVLPEAVDDNLTELIPNIYEIGSVEGDILTINKALELNVEYTCYGDENNHKILITILEDLGD
jgi:hypothetical protein